MHTIAFYHSCDLLAILAILHNRQPLTTNTNYLLPIIIKSAIIRMHTIAPYHTCDLQASPKYAKLQVLDN